MVFRDPTTTAQLKFRVRELLPGGLKTPPTSTG